MVSTKGLTMPEARFQNPDGQSVRVQLPGTRLQSGAVHYDEKIHKGHLSCICCDAPVHFRTGQTTISGDNLRGPRAHFASNRRAAHANDCTVPLRLDEGDATAYDLTKGYRIHLNTGQLKEQFDVRARLYARRPDSKIMINDPELASREPFSVRGAADFLRIMRKENKERLRHALVINGAAQIPWHDFFVRYSFHQDKKNRRGEPRFTHLVKRLAQFGSPQLVMMEVDFSKPSKTKMDCVCAEAPAIYLGRDKDKNGHYAVPRVYIEGLQQAEIARTIAARGRFLVMGAVRLRVETDARSGDVRHYLNMTVTNPAQVTPADLPRLAGLVAGKPDRTKQFSLEI